MGRASLISILSGVITFWIYYFVATQDEPFSTTSSSSSSSIIHEHYTNITTTTTTVIDDEKETPFSTTKENDDDDDDSIQSLIPEGPPLPHSNTEDELKQLRIKLTPKPLLDQKGDLLQHQFLSLHHMKTGGTSTFFFYLFVWSVKTRGVTKCVCVVNPVSTLKKKKPLSLSFIFLSF